MRLFYKSELGTARSSIAILAISLLCWGTISSDRLLATASPQPKTGTSQPLPAIDYLIVPGKRVGAITAKSTFADLVKIYGKQRLSSKKFYGAEGQVELPATLITLGQNRSLTVVWENAKKLTPFQVIIDDPTWKTAEGIGVNTSLSKLRQILGEFKITGLGWDYGNQVINLSTAMQARYTGLNITVDADRIAAAKFPADLRAVSGDGVTPAASDPRWRSLKMHISRLIVSFPEVRSSKTKI
ncbi:hypothetical protein [Chamaesiphon sp. GL140_3_metabinner_50]|uniref:hypothetical protein n=1 Tax=Chamaesiphon sp. GL140_3_metabinner_50 TaxID=2970812 RepID=UPI0025E53F93|nr:hypothetical protein [Chamaesiphon sp. GL140_3_metabinner_50]